MNPRSITLVAIPILLLSFTYPGTVHAQAVAPPQPTSFRGIALGMSLESVKEALKADALFFYRGDPDVSLVPQTEQTLIECAGTSFVRRAYFQFEKNRLFIIILELDQTMLDYYSLFASFSKKYGNPASLNPGTSVWLFDSVRFSLEKPLEVKYVERMTFDALVKSGSAQEDLEQMTRERFIEQF
jgi:hypothetical protein